MARLAEEERTGNAQEGWEAWQNASDWEEWGQWEGWEQGHGNDGDGARRRGEVGEPEGEPDSAPMSQTQGSTGAWDDITANRRGAASPTSRRARR